VTTECFDRGEFTIPLASPFSHRISVFGKSNHQHNELVDSLAVGILVDEAICHNGEHSPSPGNWKVPNPKGVIDACNEIALPSF